MALRILGRPYRFDFENNEDEERAIAEAIAREEELMRQEEVDRGGRPEPGARDRVGCLRIRGKPCCRSTSIGSGRKSTKEGPK
ncbi:hypothetical protein ANCCEY_03598 [Ancylostoma ceylanicum]|uniref:Uncharacterized protein n=1 Tax=Ancylostoma ceylanicum TaxID=53326 RepID=A0A0D6M4J8_9BILA|nr:hypothetical protein ANCCEY_03598 [Ancylostoma ceylanicum]